MARAETLGARGAGPFAGGDNLAISLTHSSRTKGTESVFLLLCPRCLAQGLARSRSLVNE